MHTHVDKKINNQKLLIQQTLGVMSRHQRFTQSRPEQIFQVHIGIFHETMSKVIISHVIILIRNFGNVMVEFNQFRVGIRGCNMQVYSMKVKYAEISNFVGGINFSRGKFVGHDQLATLGLSYSCTSGITSAASSVFSPSKIQDTTGRRGACGHIKVSGVYHSHIKGNSVVKAFWANMSCMLGRTLFSAPHIILLVILVREWP